MRSALRRVVAHIPPGQLVRYLLVGVFNTVFGYSTFAATNWLLYRRGIPASYMYAQVLSNFVNITVAYLAYKFFVFKTRGNYLREWLKAMAVYGSGFVPGLILLPATVKLLQFGLHVPIARAPYIANAVLICFTVFYSFLGHKNITFRQRPAAE
jgi:putative flippase GtrA